MWSRAVLDSNDYQEAHWIGRCYHQSDPFDEPGTPPRIKQRYLFRFGYETPDQLISNARGGWDDQDSSWVFVEAASKRDAAVLGRAFADLYVLRLFKYDNPLSETKGDAYVWSEAGYAEWIEEDLQEIAAAEGVAPVLSAADQLVPLIRSLPKP